MLPIVMPANGAEPAPEAALARVERELQHRELKIQAEHQHYRHSTGREVKTVFS